MRIEQITESRLSKIPESELKTLRFRFIQLWEKNFKGTDKQQVGSLERTDFVTRYKLLIKFMTQRGVYPQTASSLDKYIFDSAIYKFSVPNLGDIVVVPDFCSLAGSYVRNPRTAKDADIVLRRTEDQRDETLELKLGRTLCKLMDKEIEFIYHATGPHSSYIPIYDLILRPKDEMQIIKVKESKITKKKLSELEENLKTFEYLIHHVEVEGDKEIVHHCHLYDHIGNLYEQSHLWIEKGKIYLDGKEIKEGHYHVIKGLEKTQEIAWSEKEATDANIKPKRMMSGMTLKEKAKVW